MMGDFNLPAGSRGVLVRVLDGLVQCAKDGAEYTGDRKAGSGRHNKMITKGTVEEQIVAAAANGQVQRGGKREKKATTKDPWFHSDVAETRLRLIAASRERHGKK
jgi:hypothetical protein